MFGKSKKESEKVTVVTTKEQLKTAIKRKDTCIEVQGELVKKMKWMAKLSPKKIAAIMVCLTASAAVPATAPASAALATVGLGAAEMTFIVGLGAIIVLAIFKDYDIELKTGDTSLRLIANK